jgi:hypothetical protein
VTAIASGPILVSSVIVIAPDTASAAMGANVTEIVQWFTDARVAPELLVWLKFAVAVMLAMLRLTLLGLFRVIGWAALVIPTPGEPKLREDGDRALKAVLSVTMT